MKNFSCADVLSATSGILISGSTDTVFSGVCTDSRNIEAGSLFIPIVGERFDAHTFLADTLNSGAAGALVSNMELANKLKMPHKTIIQVDDTTIAMGDIASWYRGTFAVPVVAITGSVGKTSTKEMIQAIMNKKFTTLKTPGNFNNAIGLPLSIFKMDEEYNAMVLEMGMNSLGEISRLSKIAKPDISVITNIGISHIEKLGTRQNVLKAKLEIMDGMNSEGVLILNHDDAMLSEIKPFVERRVVTFGLEEGSDIRAEGVFGKGEDGCIFTMSIDGEKYSVSLKLPGVHNVYNALAAVCVGSVLGIPISDMIEALNDFTSDDSMRMFIKDFNGIKIINDCYNASPTSTNAALCVLNEINSTGRKIAVLGNIHELGEWTEKGHREVGEACVKNHIDFLVAVGDYGNYTIAGALDAGFSSQLVKFFDSNNEACEFLSKMAKTGDVVLIKGSRGAKMEQIYDCLTRGATHEHD